MAKKRFVIKMGSYEPKRGGKKQPGLDLSRTIEDTLVDDELATRSDNCCYIFTSFPDIQNMGISTNSSAIPNGSIFRQGDTLWYKGSDGTLYTFDKTVD